MCLSRREVNRHGLAVAGMVAHANGIAERRASETMLKARRKAVGHRITAGEDKAYDTADHMANTHLFSLETKVRFNKGIAINAAVARLDVGLRRPSHRFGRQGSDLLVRLALVLASATLSSVVAASAQDARLSGDSPLTAKEASRRIELYDRAGHYALDAIPPGTHPIIFQIPEAFRYGSTKVAERARGIQILTYYPNFSSPKDAENAAFGLNCIGFCDGRILLHIEYDLNPLSSPNMGDFVARSQIRWKRTLPYPPNVSVYDITPPGFDGGFQRSYSGVEHSEIVLFRKESDGSHYDLAATCESNPQRTTCILHFSLHCDPNIYVTVNGLDSSYLVHSSDIVTRVNEFVTSMIEYAACKS